MKRLFILPFVLVLLSAHAMAQGKLGVFVGVGTMFYQGDLMDVIAPAPSVRWTVDAGLHWQIDKRWGLQLNYTVGELIGDDAFALDAGRQARGFSFQSYAHEVSLRGTYDILRNDKWKLLPYLTAGVGGVYNDLTPGPVNVASAVQEPAYSNFAVSFPTGIGLKYQISCPWALKAEALYHWMLSDYLDDVSVRGNPNLKDGFWDINVGVIYFFTGCRKGNRYEDCEQLNGGVDMDKLMQQYGK